MREILILLYLVFMSIFIIKYLIENKKIKDIIRRREQENIEYLRIVQQKHQKNIDLAEQSYQIWKATEESLHRNENYYPVDWNYRRLSKLMEYNYSCQQCGKNTPEERKIYISDSLLLNLPRAWVGLHVHHIKPLSIGGNNELNNLIVLCEGCHEKQHEHMLKRKLTFFEKKQKRARSLAMISKWSEDVNKIRQALESFKI